MIARRVGIILSKLRPVNLRTAWSAEEEGERQRGKKSACGAS